MFKYSNTNKRYHTLDYFYKEKFNSKIFKVSLNAGFTCPNIDGTVGFGGCIYCSKTGSGEFAGNPLDNIEKQFNDGKEMMLKKWPNAKYIGYFQARTNTYAPVKVLKKLHDKVLEQDNVVGISIATRPDAISNECLDYLNELHFIEDYYPYLKYKILTDNNLSNYQTVTEGIDNLIKEKVKEANTYEELVTKLSSKRYTINKIQRMLLHILVGFTKEDASLMNASYILRM